MARRKLQLVVTYFNRETTYHPVGSQRGWRVCAATRQIIVGCGVPRTMIPLDNVAAYSIEEYTSGEE